MVTEVADVNVSPVARVQNTAARVAQNVLAPNAASVDQKAEWPRKSLRALAVAGLMGLHVPRHLGGLGEGLLALAIVSEELASACSSTAMCFAMHSVATKVLAAKATSDQAERYLRPIAEGRHLTALALTEAHPGSDFYRPHTEFRPDGERFRLEGQKSLVASGGVADSYVVSATAWGQTRDPGDFSCLVIDGGTAGLQWQQPWFGLGLRGMGARDLVLDRVEVPADHLLGPLGAQRWSVFEVVAPYFITAMSGLYLGIARAALEAVTMLLDEQPPGQPRAATQPKSALSEPIADMWTRIERARQLLHHSARLTDAGSPQAAPAVFAAKIEAAEAAVAVTQAAICLAGNRGYADDAAIARLLRDAQAAHILSPPTHLLRNWLGRSVLGLPLL